jgi:hypothetical protein
MAENNDIPSFIPKAQDSAKAKSQVERIRNYLNAFFFLGVLLFGAAVAGAVFSYLLVDTSQGSLEKNQEKLRLTRTEFDSEQIANLNRFDTRLRAVQGLLQSHTVFSPILDELEDHVIEVVQLKTANITYSEGEGLKISGQGEAYNYESLAAQSDEFSKGSYFTNPIIDSFQQVENDFVSFQYTIEVNPDLIFPFAAENFNAVEVGVPNDQGVNPPTNSAITPTEESDIIIE